jgi:hypothetical protein
MPKNSENFDSGQGAKVIPLLLANAHVGSKKALGSPDESGDIWGFVGVLRSRFESIQYLSERLWIDWPEVESALLSHPDKLAALKRIESAGGKPDLLTRENGELIFVDFSEELPEDFKNLDIEGALRLARQLGVDLIAERHLAYMQKIMLPKTDFEKLCLTDEGARAWREAGKAYKWFLYMLKPFVTEVTNFRALIRIPLVKKSLLQSCQKP